MSDKKECLVTLDDVQSRIFLSALSVMAAKIAGEVANPNWIRAYISLAQAADYCDAVIARSSDTPEGKK